MTTFWLLFVWLLAWLPLGAGLYLWLKWRRRAAERPAQRVEVPSAEEELKRALRRHSRK